MKFTAKLVLLITGLLLLTVPRLDLWAQSPTSQGRTSTGNPVEKVKMTMAAKSFSTLPWYFGQAKGIFRKEGVELELIVMRTPIAIAALTQGEAEYTSAAGGGMRAAIRGAPLRAVMFVQTRLSFSLVGQPGMNPKKIKTVGISGFGSSAHYAAIAVMRKLGRGTPGDEITYITTNSTAQSYATLMAKAIDAAILTPPYTSMATVARHVELGDAFDIRDIQGGLMTRTRHISEQRDQVKAVIRGALRSMDYISRREDEFMEYVQKEFNIDRRVAAPSYAILKRVLTMDGDIDEPVLNSLLDNMKKDVKVTEDIPLDRVVDFGPLREVLVEINIKKTR